MKYDELEFKEIQKEDCEILRYGDEIVLSKQCGIQFSQVETKSIKFNGKIYKRDKQEINIPWLSNRLINAYEFYDDKSSERITLIIFRTKNGRVKYGFSDHNN